MRRVIPIRICWMVVSNELPTTKCGIGVRPGWGGTGRLTKFAGRRKAKEWNLLGNLFTAATAERYDLVNRLCDPDDLDQEIAALTEVLLSKADTPPQPPNTSSIRPPTSTSAAAWSSKETHRDSAPARTQCPESKTSPRSPHATNAANSSRVSGKTDTPAVMPSDVPHRAVAVMGNC
jgi:enoyl-CoA hydratase/carnithine racemase